MQIFLDSSSLISQFNIDKKQIERENLERVEKGRLKIINRKLKLLRWLRWLPQFIKELILK